MIYSISSFKRFFRIRRKKRLTAISLLLILLVLLISSCQYTNANYACKQSYEQAQVILETARKLSAKPEGLADLQDAKDLLEQGFKQLKEKPERFSNCSSIQINTIKMVYKNEKLDRSKDHLKTLERSSNQETKKMLDVLDQETQHKNVIFEAEILIDNADKKLKEAQNLKERQLARSWQSKASELLKTIPSTSLFVEEKTELQKKLN